MPTRKWNTVLMALLLAMPVSLFAQYPPAQGPPAPSGNNIQVFDVNTFITNALKAKIQEKLVELNAEIAARPAGETKATLSLNWVQRNATIRTQTQYLDRPNHLYVKAMHIASINVDIDGYPFDRTISVSIDVNIFCNGWETGAGNIVVTGVPDPPYVEPDTGYLESAVNFFLNGWLVDHVSSKLRASLSSFSPSTTTTTAACNSLDAANQDGFDVFRFALLPTIGHAAQTALNTLTVQPIRVKRLSAHNLQGQVLYEPIESPRIDFWANFALQSFTLPALVEGQEIPLNSSPMTIPKPGSNNSLVIIANAQTSILDSAFRTFSSMAGFGNGTQTITVNKVFWTSPQPPINKPLKFIVPAYEITFQVVAPAYENVLQPMQPTLPTRTPGRIATLPVFIAP